MQADNICLRAVLGSRIRPLFGCVLVAGALAGCATAPPSGQQARRGAQSHATSGPRQVGALGLVSTGGQNAQGNTQDGHAYVPHQWPSPQKDLWSRIRSGFRLKPHDNRRSVRVWTQFYATHPKHLDAALNNAKPFLWHVVHQVEKRHMPTEIALLPIVESGYDPSAKSYMGASGLWQFMPGTAQHMSLPLDWWYDGRDDPIASTNAALNYLQTLHQRYNGNWLLALAAYNAGPGRVDAAIAKARAEGKPTDFWDLDLPQETSQYVPQLLALRRILESPARFSVQWPALPNRPRTRVVKLPAQTSLKVAAHMLGIPEHRLRELNPGLRRWASAPHAQDHLLVPAAKAAMFRRKLAKAAPSQLMRRRVHIVKRGDVLSRLAATYHVSVAALREANNLSGNRIRVGQRLTIPTPGRHQSAPPAQITHAYVVQSGDTLWHIAHRYDVSVASLRRANGAKARDLQPGDKLRIPGAAQPPAPSTVVVKRGDSLWSIAKANHVSVAELRRWNRMAPGTPLKPGMSIAVDGPAALPNFYEVQPGDSLWSIASRFSMQVNTLRDLNDLGSASHIQPGERLRLQPAVSS